MLMLMFAENSNGRRASAPSAVIESNQINCGRASTGCCCPVCWFLLAPAGRLAGQSVGLTAGHNMNDEDVNITMSVRLKHCFDCFIMTGAGNLLIGGAF